LLLKTTPAIGTGGIATGSRSNDAFDVPVVIEMESSEGPRGVSSASRADSLAPARPEVGNACRRHEWRVGLTFRLLQHPSWTVCRPCGIDPCMNLVRGRADAHAQGPGGARVLAAYGRWLPVWDALAAFASAALACEANAPSELVAPMLGGIVAPVLLATLSEYDGHAHVPGVRLRSLGELSFAAALVVLSVIAAPGAPERIGAHRTALAVATLALMWLAPRTLVGAPRMGARSRALVIGSGAAAQRVAALARRHPESGIDVVGLLDDDGPPQPDGGPPVLGGLTDLEQVLDEHGIERVIVAFTRSRDADLVGVVRRCDHLDVSVDVVPRLFDVIKPIGTLLGGLPLADATSAPSDATALALKRAIDVVGAIVGLVVTAPVMALAALAVRMTSPGPVLFRQERIGKGERPFEVLKFRTMRAAAERSIAASPVQIVALVEELKAPDDELTPLGRWLRRTSIDELPQLWCVLRGTMSLVGPRPLRPFEAACLDEWQRERFVFRPGVTGFWQVLGRSDTGWDERMRLDYLYARHWSLSLDIRILLRTVPAVLACRGAR
jgi:exopolysaccharide biosynthesis polyprenyl glycosylphosphotransferase